MRIPVIFIGALLVNLLMFSIIQHMVVNRELRLADATDFQIANFIRMSEQSRPVSSRREPKAPKKPDAETQQDLQRMAQAQQTGAAGSLAVDFPDFELDVGALAGSNISITRELIPLVRTIPEYPIQARQTGATGYVILRFTVTETGSVANPEVVRSDPPGVFDRSALRAIVRWKYQPQVADGKPVSVTSYARITYQFADEA